MKTGIGIIGCGFVADYYMATLYAYPQFEICGVFDIDFERLNIFCSHYDLKACTDANELLNNPEIEVILNLTDPRSHYDVSVACLEAGKHVYSEKPLAMSFSESQELTELAESRGLRISCAPCNALGRSAQTLKQAIEDRTVGAARLVYAQMDDGLVPVMPFKSWYSASGAPWPYRDEFEIGCTLEHSGYSLGILISLFGEIASITAFSDCLIQNKLPNEAALEPDDSADMSVGLIKFSNGVVARLTTTIVAERDYSVRIYGDRGILHLDNCWNNGASVTYQKYINIRRRTLLNPIKRKVKPKKHVAVNKLQHSKTRMDFLLGVNELVQAIRDNGDAGLLSRRALHINEAAIAISNAGASTGTYQMQSGLKA